MNIRRWFLHSSAAALCALAASSVHAQTTPATGACCVIGSSGTTTCSVGTHEACERSRGQYRGNGTACGASGACPALPPPPTGACCVTASGASTCSVLSERDCRTAHGRYDGNNVACGASNACPTRVACCLPSGACGVAFTERCTAAGGTAQAAGSACRPNPCPQPARGACCVTRGIHAYCVVATSARCTSAHGTYQGDNAACTATACPQPVVGACCIAATSTAGARCTVGTTANCTTAGGTYGGDASTCRSANCPTTCPCDWDHNGFLSGGDIAAFINDFLAGHADFNGDGTTNNDDLRAFASCFDSAPTGCVRRR